MNDKKVLSGLMASLLLCFGGAAQAAPVLPTLLVPGVQNDLEDQSREAIVDVDGDGVFGVGDVLVGFARLDAITAPAPIDLTNRLYGIFSQQVTSVAPVTAGLTNGITFGPTTAAGLTLSEITGDGANAGQMLAVYGDSGGFGGLNLLLSSPGDLTTNGTVTLADYFSHILLTGTLELNATTADLPICAGGDCFDALVTTPAGSLAMATLETLPSSVTVVSFNAGLEVGTDPLGLLLADAVPAGIGPSTGYLTTAELSLSNGAARGSLGVVNEGEWTDASELIGLNGYLQCPQNGSCGFVNDVDFSIFPTVAVPEPASMALLGLGLLGMNLVRRKVPAA